MSDFEANRDRVLEELRLTLDEVDPAQVAAAVALLSRAERVFVIGVGREGLAGRGFAMRLMHLGFEAHWGWDDTTPALRDDDVVVMVNGSGNIGHLDYVFSRIRTTGAGTLVITGAPSEKTPSLASVALRVPGAVFRGTEPVVESIQPMGTLFEQATSMVLDLMVLELARVRHTDLASMVARHRNFE